MGITELREGFTIQHEKINTQSMGINKQSDKVAKLSEEINKESLEITKQSQEINKQSEKINKLHENIEKLNKKNEKQDEEMKTNLANTSQRIELLYSITDTTKIIWRIDNVTDLMITHRSSISELYEAAGYRFNFEFRFNAEITDLRVVFPETTLKYRPFIAKCHILSSSYQEMNCRVISK